MRRKQKVLIKNLFLVFNSKKSYNELIELNNNLYHQLLLNDHHLILIVELNLQEKNKNRMKFKICFVLIPRSFNDNKHSLSRNVRYKCPGIGLPKNDRNKIKRKH